jgi:hypothetical protein
MASEEIRESFHDASRIFLIKQKEEKENIYISKKAKNNPPEKQGEKQNLVLYLPFKPCRKTNKKRINRLLRIYQKQQFIIFEI